MGGSGRQSGAPRRVQSVFPKRRQDLIRWDGWGYKDSRFRFDGEQFVFTGERYFEEGTARFDHFHSWILRQYKLDVNYEVPPVPEPTKFPSPQRNDGFLEGLKAIRVEFSEEGIDRLMRCHGQCMEDIGSLRELSFTKIPDVVVWPTESQHVIEIVRLAIENDVVLIPMGGNSSVSGAVRTPEIFDRTIAAVDMTQMNRLLWLSKENLTACFEAGAVGQDIERELQKEGFTLGHEPDSYEFSTLGGWISTRASGMKKNTYGNIEDLVVRVKLVTGTGMLQKQFIAARTSCGPDLNHMILGSEGTLGIITEAVVKIRPLPEVRKYGSLIFRNFETGYEFIREIARRRLQPSSIRLLDNLHVTIGAALSTETWFSSIVKKIGQFYLETLRGFRRGELALCMLLFEGDSQTVQSHEQQLYAIAYKHGAINGGPAHGERGYKMIFVAVYIRDIGWDYNIISESFETSVSWDKCLKLCNNVKATTLRECKRRERDGVVYPLVAYRLTQTYDEGCCVYFYLSFRFTCSRERAIQVFSDLEEVARDEIIACGGTISHHHGVGKVRRKWFVESVSEVGSDVLQAVKQQLDPTNVFAAGNLLSEKRISSVEDERTEKTMGMQKLKSN